MGILALRLVFFCLGLLLIIGGVHALGAATGEYAEDTITGGLNGIVWGLLLLIASFAPYDAAGKSVNEDEQPKAGAEPKYEALDERPPAP